MRRCGSPQNICRPNATKMRRCVVAKMRDIGYVHPALLYCIYIIQTNKQSNVSEQSELLLKTQEATKGLIKNRATPMVFTEAVNHTLYDSDIFIEDKMVFGGYYCSGSRQLHRNHPVLRHNYLALDLSEQLGLWKTMSPQMLFDCLRWIQAGFSKLLGLSGRIGLDQQQH